jgi:spermidine synthase
VARVGDPDAGLKRNVIASSRRLGDARRGRRITIASASRRAVVVLYLAMAASGAAALSYEVSWFRQLGLVFGHTARAAAVVLAAYFMGMAVGHALAARITRRFTRPLLGFALAEVAAGSWALLLPLLVVPLGSSLGRLAGESSTGSELLRAGAAIAVLLPGTVALGATLPFVAEAIGNPRGRTDRIARAYAANTFGAVVGVVLTTGWSIVHVGVVQTSRLAALVSLTVAAIAVFLSGAFMRSSAAPPGESTRASRDRDDGLWLTTAAISGFGILASEVLYTRMFSLVLHNSTYTFGSVLAVVLVALAASAATCAWLLRRTDPRTLAASACLVAALGLVGSAVGFVEATSLTYFSTGESFSGYLVGVLGLVTVVIGAPVLAMGMLLPLTWHALRKRANAGRVVGRTTMVNTLAAAMGAIAASFVLLPLLDLWWSVAVVALTYVVLGARFTAGLSGQRRNRMRWAFALVVPLCLGATMRASTTLGLRPHEELVTRRSGAYGWIDVVRHRPTDNLRLRQNVHYGMGSSRSSPMELRQGHLPLLLHPAPRDVVFIGLATGITASAALQHDSVKTITVIELIPEVVEAARLFADVNADVVDDPRTRILLGDGRHVLAHHGARFDVIVSDLFVPWESETGYLYTAEHFEAVRDRLAPGGLFVQWMAAWQVSARELDIIADTMGSVFPHVSIWRGSTSPRRTIFALVGTEGSPRTLDRGAITARMQGLAPPPVGQETTLRTVDDLERLYLGDWQPVGVSRLNTDEHPVIEFLAPESHRTKGATLVRDALTDYVEDRLLHLPREAFRFSPTIDSD